MNDQNSQLKPVSTPSVDARQVISRIYFWTGILFLSPFIIVFLGALVVPFIIPWGFGIFLALFPFLFFHLLIIICNFLRLIIARQIKKQKRFSRIMIVWAISFSAFLISWFMSSKSLGYPTNGEDLYKTLVPSLFGVIPFFNFISWIFMDPYLLWIVYHRSKKNNL